MFSDALTAVLNQASVDSNAAYEYLAKNETAAVYAETEDEKLVFQLKRLANARLQDDADWKDLKKQDPKAPYPTANWDVAYRKAKEWAVSLNSRMSSVISSTDLVEYFLMLLQLGSHMRRAPCFKMAEILKHDKVSVGVSLQSMSSLIQYTNYYV